MRFLSREREEMKMERRGYAQGGLGGSWRSQGPGCSREGGGSCSPAFRVTESGRFFLGAGGVAWSLRSFVRKRILPLWKGGMGKIRISLERHNVEREICFQIFYFKQCHWIYSLRTEWLFFFSWWYIKIMYFNQTELYRLKAPRCILACSLHRVPTTRIRLNPGPAAPPRPRASIPAALWDLHLSLSRWQSYQLCWGLLKLGAQLALCNTKEGRERLQGSMSHFPPLRQHKAPLDLEDYALCHVPNSLLCFKRERGTENNNNKKKTDNCLIFAVIFPDVVFVTVWGNQGAARHYSAGEATRNQHDIPSVWVICLW